MSAKKIFIRILIISVVVISTSAAFAQKFSYRLYTMQDGLPGLDVSAIIADSRGYLWVSSYGGLSRFDGKTFKNYGMSDGLPQYSGAYNFVEDTLGRIWFIYNRGVGVFDGVKFVEYPIENAPTDIRINELLETMEHKMRFVSFKGIYELENKSWKKLNLFPHNPDVICNYAEETDDGCLLINCLDSIVKINKNGHHETIISTNNADERFKTLMKTGGQLFTSTLNHLYVLKGNHFETIHDDVLKNKDIYFEFIDSKKRLWVGTINNGIFVFSGNTYQQINPPELNLYQISKFCEDYEGNIWATTSNGLLKLSPSWIDFYNKDNALVNKQEVRSTFKDSDGTLYFGHTKGGFSKWSNNSFASSKDFLDKPSSNLIDNWVQGFSVDGKKHVWLFTNDNTLIRMEGNHAENMSTKWNIHPGSAAMMYNFFDNTLYTANPYGVMKVKDDNFKIDSLPNFRGNKITSIASDLSHNVWFSTSKGKIYMQNKNGSYSQMNHLLGIDSIFLTLKWINNSLWIVTNGLGIYKYHCTADDTYSCDEHITTKDGLPSDIVFSIASDNKNSLWVSTIAGLAQVSFHKENNKETYSINKYGEKEGFNNKSYYYATLVTDNNNDVWYGTDEYLARIYSGKISEDTTPAIIHIENVSLFYSTTNWAKYTASFSPFFHLPLRPVLPYNQNDITIDFKAITFGNENNIEYAYQCDGIDTGWANTGSITHITFANLSAGTYTFNVRAKKPHSRWSSPAVYSFTILPPYWETWWFRLLLFITVASLIYSIYRFRMKQLIKLQNMRNKIASDLHDDIGSTLNSISLYSEVAKQAPDKHKEALDMIGESSRKIIDSISDIVWTINPENDNLENIIERMRSHSYNNLRAKNIEFTFKADESLNKLKLTMENRRNFYLIFKETLTNLVKYSEATRVSIIVADDNNHVKLIIRDNGKGFDTTALSNGNGLTNMKRRAAEMKAELKIESSTENGTTIELKF